MDKTYFGAAPNDINKSFNESFGTLELNKDAFGGVSREYYNPFTKVDKRNEIISKIDVSTGGAGTAGYALVPVYPDPTIVDRTIRQLPLRNLIPKRAVKGLTYDYNALTAKGGAVFAVENESIADQTDTYDRLSVDIKFMYAKGRSSGPVIAGAKGFVDIQSLDISVKTTSLMELEEDTIVNGVKATYPEEYDGLITLIATNATNKLGTLPTLADIRAELATTFNANGQVSLAVTDASTHNYIKGLLLDIQRQVSEPKDMLPFGIPGSFEFDGVLFIKDRYMPTTGSAKRILFLDMRYIFMAVLQDMTYEEKASENDSYVYLIKMYEALVCTFEASCSQIYGIL